MMCKANIISIPLSLEELYELEDVLGFTIDEFACMQDTSDAQELLVKLVKYIKELEENEEEIK